MYYVTTKGLHSKNFFKLTISKFVNLILNDKRDNYVLRLSITPEYFLHELVNTSVSLTQRSISLFGETEPHLWIFSWRNQSNGIPFYSSQTKWSNFILMSTAATIRISNRSVWSTSQFVRLREIIVSKFKMAIWNFDVDYCGSISNLVLF